MLHPVPSSSPSPSSDHYHRAVPYALIRLRHSNLVLNRHHAMVFLQTPNQIVIVRCTYAEADTTTMQPNPSISDDESMANRHFQIPHWNEEAAVALQDAEIGSRPMTTPMANDMERVEYPMHPVDIMDDVLEQHTK